MTCSQHSPTTTRLLMLRRKEKPMLDKIKQTLRYWYVLAPLMAIPLFPGCPLSPFE
jgi:hypothetical protein